MIKKHYNRVLRLVIFFTVFVFMGCVMSNKRNMSITEETASEVDEAPMTVKPVSKPTKLKKTITDLDLKKDNEDKELKKRVVILPIIDKQALRKATVLKNARNAFMDSLNNTGELIAIDSGVLKLDLTQYIKDNTYDLQAIAEKSQKAGVSSILEPRIIDMRFKNENLADISNSSSSESRIVAFEIVVQVRVFNIRSEQELFNTVKTVSLVDENSKISENITSENFFNKNPELTELLIKDAFMDFNTKLVESLKSVVWEGRIAAMQGEKIYLNVGQISGVQIGDILKVVDEGSEIYDKELGYHVGKAAGRVKGTLEVVGYFGQDGAISVIHSGAGFKENDRVELYQ